MKRYTQRPATRILTLALATSCLSLLGCGGSSDKDSTGGGDGGPTLDGALSPTGRIEAGGAGLGIDAPGGYLDGSLGVLDQGTGLADVPYVAPEVANSAPDSRDAPAGRDASLADAPAAVDVGMDPVAAVCPTAASTTLAGAVQSTAAGGVWFDKATWVGGVVPAPYQDVVINGEVQVNAAPDKSIATCRTLLVSSAGVVRGAAYSAAVLQVRGDLLNQGIVRNGPGSASYDNATLEVQIGGSFYQGGGYGVVTSRFVGTQEQFIAVAADKILSGAFVDENAAAPLKGCSPITANAFTLTAKAVPPAGSLDMQNHALTLAAGDVKFSGGGLRASRIVGVEGATLTCDRMIANGTLSLEGDLRINNMAIDGNVKVAAGAALYNQGYTDPTLLINGNLENLGIVRWGPGVAAYGAGTLTIGLTGNLSQGGTYTVTLTNLTGTAAQTITVGAGKVLTGAFKDTTPATPIMAGSDLAITDATFDLGPVAGPTSTIKMGSFKILHESGDLKIATGILEADDMTGSADGTSTFTIANVTPPSGTLTVRKHFRTDSMKVNGNLTVAAGSVLYNKGYVEARLTVSGTVTQTGIIGSGAGFASYDTGVVYLNGVLQPGWTR